MCVRDEGSERGRGGGRDLRSRRHVDSAVVMCDSSNQLFFRKNRLSFFTSLLVVKDHLLVIIEKAI